MVREVDGKQEKETTTSPEDQTIIDRALSRGGLLLLRLGVVAMASFLAGATVQRIIAMDFSGKFGPIELRKLSKAAAASSTTVAAVARDLGKQMAVIQRTATLASDTARRIAAVDDRHSAELAQGLDEQAAATRRAAKLAAETAKRLRGLEARVPDATGT